MTLLADRPWARGDVPRIDTPNNLPRPDMRVLLPRSREGKSVQKVQKKRRKGAVRTRSRVTGTCTFLMNPEQHDGSARE